MTRWLLWLADEMAEQAVGVGFEVVQNYCDKRLLVNRGLQLKMYRFEGSGRARQLLNLDFVCFRVWVQCKFRKPPLAMA